MGASPLDQAFAALGLETEYEVLGELGRGGVSVVYLARDRVLGREVAIKVVRDLHLGNSEARARFEREARILASLQHPHIVTLYGAKRIPEDSLALIMQHGDWRTLKAVVQEAGPLPAAQVERVLRDLGQALIYLHRHGIVHRDIKPENIFIERETGRALLSDFGIAKSGDGQASVTLTGVVIGTPAYMSPEQIDGAEPSGLSDLYSLGMVGYEMVSGRRPWEGESLYSVIFKQKNERLPDLRQLRPDVPEALCSAIEGAVEKEPAARWPDIETFLARLPGPESLEPEAFPVLLPVRHASAVSQVEAPTVEVSRLISEADAEFAAERSGRIRQLRRRALAAVVVVMLLGGGVGAVALTISNGRTEGAQVPPQPAPAAAADPEPAANPVLAEAVLTVPTESVTPAPEPRSVAPAPANPEPTRTTAPVAAPPVEPPPAEAASTLVSLRERAELLLASAESALVRAAPSTTDVARVQQPAQPSRDLILRPYSATAGAAHMAQPEIVNRTDIARLLNEFHPVELRNKGIGGTVVVAILVAETGGILDTRIATSSGRPLLDNAALEVAKLIRFGPTASNAPQRRWVSLPVTFAGRLRDEP